MRKEVERDRGVNGEGKKGGKKEKIDKINGIRKANLSEQWFMSKKNIHFKRYDLILKKKFQRRKINSTTVYNFCLN